MGTTDRAPNSDMPEFLNFLRKEIARYLGVKAWVINYEQIAYLALQIDREYGSRRNPAFQDWLKKAEKKFPLLPRKHSHYMADEPIMAYAHEALAFMTSAIAIELSKYYEPKGFDWLNELIANHDLNLNFVTLNHDVLLESFLRKVGFNFHDGFYDQGDHDRFSGSRLHSSPLPKLIKLHGSLDWHPCNGISNYHIARTRKGGPDKNHHIHQNGTQSYPLLTIGTYNKLEDYNYGVFPHLLTCFQNLLYQTDKVVVSGYGFGDAGVNLRLFDWLGSEPSKQLVIIHPKPSELELLAPYHAKVQLKRFFRIKKLQFLNCAFEATDAATLAALLFSN